jgi:hypothetical protein
LMRTFACSGSFRLGNIVTQSFSEAECRCSESRITYIVGTGSFRRGSKTSVVIGEFPVSTSRLNYVIK